MWDLLLVGQVAAFDPLFTTLAHSCIPWDFFIVYSSIVSLFAGG